MTGFSHAAPRAGRWLIDGFDVFSVAWRERRLLARLMRRDLEQRYRGSTFGAAWTILSPLFMLGLFTFVFQGVYGARWVGADQRPANYATLLFVGLSFYWMISDPIGRAPHLLIEQKEFVKKVLFPIDLLSWVASLSALVSACINLSLALAGFVYVYGLPPLAILSLPLIIAPLFFFGLGIGWALSALGVFIRDLQPIVAVGVSGIMFLSPIFFPLSNVPEPYRFWMGLNPLAPLLEAARNALVMGAWPDWGMILTLLFLSWICAGLGHAVFLRLRHAFADVL
jgi:lipopolysaccharide transport system permease protein